MATTTPNYGWDVPTSTDYVKDGATAIETLGDDIDATLWTALGGAYPGLRLVKKQTVGTTVSSVTVTSAFSATYENYKIIYTGGVQSANQPINMTLGSATANYSSVLVYCSYTNTTVTAVNNNAGNDWEFVGYGGAVSSLLEVELYGPFLTKNTFMAANHIQGATLVAGRTGGVLNDTTSHSSFTISPAGGTFTGGTIYVYGYGIS